MKMPEPMASMMTGAEREKWKRIRNTLTPAFSALKMKQMVPLMNACCKTLLRKLSEVADKDQSVNMYMYVVNHFFNPSLYSSRRDQSMKPIIDNNRWQKISINNNQSIDIGNR